MYPRRRRRAEGQRSHYDWPGIGGCGAGAKAAAGCHRRGDGEATGRQRTEEGSYGGAAIRKNVWRHAQLRLLLPCPHATPMDLRLGPVSGAVVSVIDIGVGAEERRFPTAGAVAMAPGREPWTQGRG
ncbi:MAG: hypothetical protein Q8L00_10115 [Deltaproteobacteria bacterium]|nr:hypothetical protein [Deltaproteobacteria bacterium]